MKATEKYLFYIDKQGHLIAEMKHVDKFLITGVDNRENVFSDELKYISFI